MVGNERYLLVIGSVTPSQYHPVRQDLIRQGLKPIVLRFSEEEWELTGLEDGRSVYKAAGRSVQQYLVTGDFPLANGSAIRFPGKALQNLERGEDMAIRYVTSQLRFISTLAAVVIEPSIWLNSNSKTPMWRAYFPRRAPIWSKQDDIGMLIVAKG